MAKLLIPQKGKQPSYKSLLRRARIARREAHQAEMADQARLDTIGIGDRGIADRAIVEHVAGLHDRAAKAWKAVAAHPKVSDDLRQRLRGEIDHHRHAKLDYVEHLYDYEHAHVTEGVPIHQYVNKLEFGRKDSGMMGIVRRKSLDDFEEALQQVRIKSYKEGYAAGKQAYKNELVLSAEIVEVKADDAEYNDTPIPSGRGRAEKPTRESGGYGWFSKEGEYTHNKIGGHFATLKQLGHKHEYTSDAVSEGWHRVIGSGDTLHVESHKDHIGGVIGKIKAHAKKHNYSSIHLTTFGHENKVPREREIEIKAMIVGEDNLPFGELIEDDNDSLNIKAHPSGWDFVESNRKPGVDGWLDNEGNHYPLTKEHPTHEEVYHDVIKAPKEHNTLHDALANGHHRLAADGPTLDLETHIDHAHNVIRHAKSLAKKHGFTMLRINTFGHADKKPREREIEIKAVGTTKRVLIKAKRENKLLQETPHDMAAHAEVHRIISNIPTEHKEALCTGGCTSFAHKLHEHLKSMGHKSTLVDLHHDFGSGEEEPFHKVLMVGHHFWDAKGKYDHKQIQNYDPDNLPGGVSVKPSATHHTYDYMEQSSHKKDDPRLGGKSVHELFQEYVSHKTVKSFVKSHSAHGDVQVKNLDREIVNTPEKASRKAYWLGRLATRRGDVAYREQVLGSRQTIDLHHKAKQAHRAAAEAHRTAASMYSPGDVEELRHHANANTHDKHAEFHVTQLKRGEGIYDPESLSQGTKEHAEKHDPSLRTKAFDIGELIDDLDTVLV